jgi:hypothetical protein
MRVFTRQEIDAMTIEELIQHLLEEANSGSLTSSGVLLCVAFNRMKQKIKELEDRVSELEIHKHSHILGVL